MTEVEVYIHYQDQERVYTKKKREKKGEYIRSLVKEFGHEPHYSEKYPEYISYEPKEEKTIPEGYVPQFMQYEHYYRRARQPDKKSPQMTTKERIAIIKEQFSDLHVETIQKRIETLGYKQMITMDTICLILCYLHLYYAPQEILITQSLIEDLSVKLVLPISIMKIEKMLFKIHSNDRQFYYFFSPFISTINKKRFLLNYEQLINNKKVKDSLGVDCERIVDQTKQLITKFMTKKEFRTQRKEQYDMNILTLMFLAYKEVTGKRGNPFMFLTSQKRKFLTEKRSMMKKLLLVEI